MSDESMNKELDIKEEVASVAEAAPVAIEATPVSVEAAPVAAEIPTAPSKSEKKVKEKKPKKEKTAKAPSSGKSKVAKVFLWIGVIISLAGIAVSGFMTSWFGLVKNEEPVKGPLHNLNNAVINTIKAESFTLSVDSKDSGDKGTVCFVYSDKDDRFTVYSVFNSGSVLIEKNNIYTYTENGAAPVPSSEKLDQKSFVKAYSNALKGNTVDWKSLFSALELDEIIKGNKAKSFMELLCDTYMMDKEWLCENFGYEPFANEYCFEFEVVGAYAAILDVAEEADALKAKRKDLLNEVEDSFGKARMSVTVTIKDDMLASISITTEEKKSSSTVDIVFFDFGKTKISSKETEAFKDMVDECLDGYICFGCKKSGTKKDLSFAYNDWYCENCLEDYEESIYHPTGKCDECRDEGVLYVHDSGNYCLNCHIKMNISAPKPLEKCNNCRKEDELTLYEGYRLCQSCYGVYLLCLRCGDLTDDITSNGITNICDNCAEEYNYDTCDGCEALTEIEEYTNGYSLCEECVDNHTFCAECDTLITFEFSDDDDYYCRDCYYSALFDYCDNCNAYTTLTSLGSYNVCDSCYNSCKTCYNCDELTSSANKFGKRYYCDDCYENVKKKEN